MDFDGQLEGLDCNINGDLAIVSWIDRLCFHHLLTCQLATHDVIHSACA